MDDRRFDALARALGGASTRRSALAALAGMGLGLAGGAAREADAKKKTRKNDGPQSAGKRRNRKRCKPACTGNFSCIKGQCVCEQALCGTACCDTGQVCQRGRCVGQGTVFCHDLQESCGDGTPCCDGLQCGSGYGGAPVACWPVPGGECESDAECAYGHHCKDGACVIDPPPQPQPNPDTDTDPGSGGGGCPSGQTTCGGSCVDTQTDRAHCGACDNACPTGQGCRAGACAIAYTHSVSFGVQGTATGASQTDGMMMKGFGFFVDAAGEHLWYADGGNNRVTVWKKSGNAWSQAAGFGASGTANGASQTDGMMTTPSGIAVDPAGATVWVADRWNARVVIWKKQQDGSWSHTASFGTFGDTGLAPTDGKIRQPMGIFVAADGKTAWVADDGNHRITVWEKQQDDSWSHVASFGTKTTTETLGQADGTLNLPMRVFVDATGSTAWVADASNSRIAVWEKQQDGTWKHTASFGTKTTTETLGQADGTLNMPYAVSVDASGTIAWVADALNNRMAVWTKGANGWSHVASFGTYGRASGATQSDGNLYNPTDIAVDADGATAWMADSQNSRMVAWTA